jgi:hypothetical protein
MTITPEDMDAERLVTYPTEAFLSRDYLQAEKKLRARDRPAQSRRLGDL